MEKRFYCVIDFIALHAFYFSQHYEAIQIAVIILNRLQGDENRSLGRYIYNLEIDTYCLYIIR